jgi:hypothetical protein
MDELDRYLQEQQVSRLRELEAQNARLRSLLDGRGTHAPPGTALLDRADDDREVLLRRLRKAEERVAELEQMLAEVLDSRSWRILRKVGIAKR